MQKIKNKSLAILIAVLLIISMATSLISFPDVSAQTSQSSLKTYAYIGATPNPVGVGQEVLLHVGITRELTNVAMTWDGLSVTIVTPDNKTETLSNIKADSTGGTGVVYLPKMVGNYTLQTISLNKSHLQLKWQNATAGTKMLASNSDKLTLIVQRKRRPSIQAFHYRQSIGRDP